MKPNGYIKIDKCNLCTLAATAVVYLEMEYEKVYKEGISKFIPRGWFLKDRTFEQAEKYYKEYYLHYMDAASLCVKLCSIGDCKKKAEKYLQVSVNSDTLDIVEVSIEDYLFLKEWNKKA